MIKKAILAITVSAFTLNMSAQKLISKISEDALYVMSVNGENVLNKVSENEIDNSLLFSQFSRKIFRNSEKKSLKDIGVDFKNEMHFAVEFDEESEMVYMLFLYPIEDKTKFGAYILEQGASGAIVKGKKYDYFKSKYGSDVLAWNKEYAVFMEGNYMGDKYKVDYSDYYQNSQMISEVMREYTKTKDFYTSLQTVEKKYEEIEKNKKVEKEEVKSQAEKASEELVEILDVAVADEQAYQAADDRSDDYYDRKREARRYFDSKDEVKRDKVRAERKTFVRAVIDKRLIEVFGKTKGFKSIEGNASYRKSVDAKADATLWFKNNASKFFLMGTSSYRYGRMDDQMKELMKTNVSGETVAKLYFEKEKASIKINGEYGETVKKTMSKIFDQKLDSRFYNYMNKDLVGYFSFSGSVSNFLKETPSLYADMYQKVMPRYEDEIGLSADMFSLIIDEDAIGDLVVGEGVFVVNGISSHEVTYKTYEYDEDYNMTQVEKTKTEYRPDFLYMMSSKNEKILNKLFKIGVSKKVLTAQGEYFTTIETNRDLPIKLFMAFKDDMFFVSTQESEIKEVLAGGKGNLGNEHKAIMEANTSVVYYNNEKMLKQVPQDKIRGVKEKQAFNYFMENSKDSFWTFNAKDGNLNSEIVVNVPKGEKNSAKYFFDMLNKMLEIDRGR